MSLATVILAAGKGTRMRSVVPKPLQPICGQPMLAFLLERAHEAGSKKTIVVAGHQIEKIRAALGKRTIVIEQKQQLGSGHAVSQSARLLAASSGSVLVLYCDTPLIKKETLKELLDNHRRQGTDATILSFESPRPAGYGRVKRGADGRVSGIVEESEASDEERTIREINVGCYVFNAKKLFSALKRVQKSPVKKEFYLTDVIGLLSQEGRVEAVKTGDHEETLGVNTLADLAVIRSVMQKRICERWMSEGVAIQDPKSTFIDSDVRIGQDTVLLPHTVIAEGSRIGDRCVIGPFARIRGSSRIGPQSVIGNFVEIVRSHIGIATQVKHLSYLGDARVGDRVNVGAGTITANYDGKNKHVTVIRDRAQIGSGTILVAPTIVGYGAKTGAGAVVTKGTRVKDGATYVGVPAKELRAK